MSGIKVQVGDRVVVEPKSPTAPGWVYVSPPPAGVVTDINGLHATLELDDGDIQVANLQLLTSWGAWRRRKPVSPVRKLPQLSKARPLDTDLGYEEPLLFEDLP